MHFYIEPAKITQLQTDAYGPVIGNETNQYRVTSSFQLTQTAKAFACQDSLMIVQQSSFDPLLVNVILKPIEGLKIPFSSVKYFIYRGMLKSSFISGTDITPQATTNSEFIASFWTDWNNYKTSTNQQTINDPTPQTFGYDNSLAGTLDVEYIYDNSQTDVRAIFVKEGEWIGDFSECPGFEIVLSDGIFNAKLNYLRIGENVIDVSAFPDSTNDEKFTKRAKKEEILRFIDPAAFWGLHFNSNIYINGSQTNPLAGESIYSDLLINYLTKNRIYLDIRSEKGYSYNFYNNYNDDQLSSNQLKFSGGTISPIETKYNTNEWPVFIIELPCNTNGNWNEIKLNLRINDNLKPIIFFENKKIISDTNTNRFIDETEILDGTATDWSKELTFKIPNTGSGTIKDNVGYYVKLNYFRKEYNPASPDTVLKNENDLDNIFGTLDMPFLGDVNYLFNHSINPNLFFLKGQFPSLENFSYIANSGAYYDNTRVAFYAQMCFGHKNSNRFYYMNTGSGNKEGLNLNGNFNSMSFLARDIGITKLFIQEIISPSVYQKVGILDIFAYNGFPSSEENIFVLGITQSELSILKSVIGLSDNHPRYIVFEDVSVPPFIDKDGKLFKKYRLKVQGLDSNGERDIIAPLTDVFVYTNRGFLFSSKEFADAEILATNETYLRNFEESIGFNNIEDISKKRYEDYFIENINPNMKTEVDGFISTLANIQDDVDFYYNVKALIEDSGRDIWDEAVNFVQANSNANPDDRPLYWARNKMQVALKSHVHFNGGKNNSDLDNLIKLFEEKSRNYTGVDFTSNNSAFTAAYQQNPLLKKVLINGFDPFQLNPIKGNIEQSNPSGANALSLHNTIIYDGVNPIGIIQSTIFPVRYQDFDNGVIETFFEKFINTDHNEYYPVDIIFTISQGGVFQFWIERFASKYRGELEDNLNIKGWGKAININGDQFYETQLPVNKIVPSTNSGEFAIFYNNSFEYNYNSSKVLFLCEDYDYNVITGNIITANDFTDGIFEIENSNHPLHLLWTTSPSFHNSNRVPNWYYGPTPNELTNSTTPKKKNIIAKNGSGGAYLSNEIFYRVSILRATYNPSLDTGHLHLPLIQGETNTVAYYNTFGKPVELNFNKARTKSIILKVIDIIKHSLLILIFMFFLFNSYSQPISTFIEFNIYDSNKIILPNDSNYIIDPPTDLPTLNKIAYIRYASKCEIKITILKKSTNIKMIINSEGCNNKKIIFKEGIITVSD